MVGYLSMKAARVVVLYENGKSVRELAEIIEFAFSNINRTTVFDLGYLVVTLEVPYPVVQS